MKMSLHASIRIAAIACALLIHAGTASPAPNYSGIWWKPTEAGWAIVAEHQIDVVFAAWLTYDAQSQPTWFFVPAAVRNRVVEEEGNGPNSFLGDIYRSRAPAVTPNGVFNFPASIEVASVGHAVFHFDGLPVVFVPGFNDPLMYPPQFQGVSRFKFGQRVPECSEPGGIDVFRNLPHFTASNASSNLQGLWWNSPAGSESGWGVYVAQQGDVMFAIWLTYSSAGEPEWFSMELRKVALNTYRGPIIRSTGPPHESKSFDPALVTRTQVGGATLAFGDYFNGTFAPWWNDERDEAMPVKTITRLQMTEAPILCR